MKKSILIDLDVITVGKWDTGNYGDYLITFNRIHLKNKKEAINEVLKKYGLKTIRIAGPEEV